MHDLTQVIIEEEKLKFQEGATSQGGHKLTSHRKKIEQLYKYKIIPRVDGNQRRICVSRGK